MTITRISVAQTWQIPPYSEDVIEVDVENSTTLLNNMTLLYSMTPLTSTTLLPGSGRRHRDSNCHIYPKPENSSCSIPVQDVFYLKTYKTGSSTLSTLMYRLAWKYDLSVLPLLYDVYPYSVTDGAVAQPLNGSRGLKYNILPEHIKFKCEAMLKYLNQEARYIVSLRHPLAQYKSIVHEFRLKGALNINDSDPAHYILHHLDKFKDRLNNSRQMGATKSMQIQQLGLNLAQLDNSDTVNNFILSIDKIFDFVIISEYFDESMVLLRRKFCWQTKDIYYLVQRPGTSASYLKYKTAPYDEETRKIHQKWSAADYKLYHFFVNRLLSDIESMPQDYWDEVAQYKMVNGQIADFCNQVEEKLKQNTSAIYTLLGDWKTGEGITSITIDSSCWGDSFKVDAFDCAFMKLETIVIRNLLRLKRDRGYCSYQLNNKPIYNIINKQGNIVNMNLKFCSDWSDKFNAPIKVFADRNAYMWNY